MLVPVSYFNHERDDIMSIQIKTIPYLCRTSRASRVYTEPTDTKSSIDIIDEKTLFISYRQAYGDSNTLFQITAPYDQEHNLESIPYDKWVSVGSIEYYPLDDENAEINLYKERTEYFLVNKDDIVLFKNSQSLNPLPYTVEKGSFIETDLYIVHDKGNRKETRHRIKAINDDTNNDLVGYWMEGNPIIYTNGAVLHYNELNLNPVDPTSPTFRYEKKRIEDTAYVDYGDSYAGYEPGSQEARDQQKRRNKAAQEKAAKKAEKKKWTWQGHNIDKEVVKRASEMLRTIKGISLGYDNWTNEKLTSGKYKEDCILYYNVAAYEMGKTGLVTGGYTKTAVSHYNALINQVWNKEGGHEYQFKSTGLYTSNFDPKTGTIKYQKGTRTTTGAANDTKAQKELADANASTTTDGDGFSGDGGAIAATGVSEEDVKAANQAELEALQFEEVSLDELYERYHMQYDESTSLEKVPIGRLSFVHGMPFQYTYLTDRRNNEETPYGREMYSSDEPVKAIGSGLDMYGRTFAREIVANTPIVVFTPGVPKFMSNIRQSIFGHSDNSSNKIRGAFANLFGDMSYMETGSALQEMFDDLGDGVFQYYSLEINTVEYYNMVNSLCQFSAKLMQLDDVKMRNTACTYFNWAHYNKNEAHDYSTMEEVFGVSQGVSFAFDPLSTMQDDIGNTTQESSFAGLFNGVSDKSRELAFMLGTVDIDLDMIDQTEYTASVASVRDGIFSGISNPMSQIFSMLKNSAHGMKVRFPQLWTESSFNKSYSLDMKFIAPYATTFCKWRYVLVPFFHLFALAAPQSKDSIINYSRPFLIKAYSRGYFNIEMGIIERLSWKRYGDGEMLATDGVPTELDVSVDIQDLYQQLAASTHYSDNGAISLDRIKVFFNNAGLQELMGNLAGIDTNRITLTERIALYASSAKGAFKGSFFSFNRHFYDRVTRFSTKWFYGL